jgi:mRNA-degrading endonuclease RelE of RelBE toxin-antitoxin system
VAEEDPVREPEAAGQDLAAVEEGLAELRAGLIDFTIGANLLANLAATLWPGPADLSADAVCESRAYHLPRESAAVSAPHEQYAPRYREWSIGMSSAFRKAIRGLDHTLLARTLTELSEMIRDPFSSRGGNPAPLKGNQKGLWRLRIGKYRLIYLPDPALRQIVLLDLVSRGQVYE